MSAPHIDTPTIPSAAPGIPLAKDALLALVRERIEVEPDPSDRWDLTVVVASGRLRDLMRFLRDDPRLRMDVLLDIAGVDYLAFPGHRDARFAVVYLLKSLAFNHRIKVKVRVEEEALEIPSIHDCWKIADWMERECWDQLGIVFKGHPNLKRLLNHHQFVGHPLRKDYPCQKRQKLTVNDPMVDQLQLRLRQLGYTVLSEGEIHAPAVRGGTPGEVVGTGDKGMQDPDLTTGTQVGDMKRSVL
ncbi:MAG: NADH-quinone oxidoreductase subunit C [Planctomycetes bacterium]|nr:NADH-quinone oxidoreductase subunit C [Planctomycetota bacterium]